MKETIDVSSHLWAMVDGVWTEQGPAACKQAISTTKQCHADLVKYVHELAARSILGERPSKTDRGATVYDCIDAYLKSLKGKQRSASHARRAADILNTKVRGGASAWFCGMVWTVPATQGFS